MFLAAKISVLILNLKVRSEDLEVRSKNRVPKWELVRRHACEKVPTRPLVGGTAMVFPLPPIRGGRICSMHWTCVFYGLVILIQLPIFWFIWSIWHKATTIGWRYTNYDSRDTYVDVAKTMITASGIAVALLASITLSFDQRPTNTLAVFSAKVAAASLICCVCASLVVVVALARGHEQAKSRQMDKLRREGHQGPIETDEGALNNFELGVILIFACVALSCFFTGFLFLGRIVFHF
jgi:hypothetical protein